MHYTLLTSLALAAATVTTAFEHKKGDANGMYIHGFDAAGKPTVQYLGLPGSGPLKKPIAPRDVLSPSPVHPRDFTPQVLHARKAEGPTGKEGPNCDSETKRDATQFAAVRTVLGWGCDSLTWWHRAISFVYQDVVAYACDYGNGNHCQTDSVTSQWEGIDATCGNTTAGWYSDKKDLFALGRTAMGHQFCFKNEIGGQGATPNSDAQGALAAAENQFANSPMDSSLTDTSGATAPAPAAPAPAAPAPAPGTKM